MKQIIIYFGKRFFELLTKISPKFSAKLLFFIRTKKIPNLKNPKTFNEKTTYLKLYDYANNDLVIKCADKYKVREYIKEKGYESILNDLYGVYNSFDEIDFDSLPDKFVLKCTHGCAYNIICDDKSKFNIYEARKKVNKWMKEKYGLATTELHYTKIKPKIIIEKYLCNEQGTMPTDYKFYCMNGKIKIILVCSEREKKLKLNYYDNNWNEVFYGKKSLRNVNKIEKPKNLDKMIKISEILGKNFPYVRVDLYNDNGKIIFGELTFTPACSCAPYYSKEGNLQLGKMLDLKQDN